MKNKNKFWLNYLLLLTFFLSCSDSTNISKDKEEKNQVKVIDESENEKIKGTDVYWLLNDARFE